jgi:arylsulfatase
MCSPTRSCLLTGRNHHAVGMGYLADFDTGFDNARGAVSPRAATLAAMLSEAGYGTYALGKWHLTPPMQPGRALPELADPARLRPLLRLPRRRGRPVGPRALV